MNKRPASGAEVFQFFASRGFVICEEDSSGRVVMSRDCDNALWPDGIYLPHRAPYLPVRYIEALLTKAKIPFDQFWRD
jgi:hypothetical protein